MIILEGWIKVHRKLAEHWLWYEKPFDKARAWLDLLIMVNHKDRKIMFDGSLIEVKAGQKITSLRQLSERWGWSTKKVKSFLECLENDKMLTFTSDKKKTVISIDNYSLYQHEETAKKHRRNTEETLRKTNKNDKNEKNNIYSDFNAHIEEIRKLYPGTKSKKVAYLKLPKLIEEYGKEQLIRCIERYTQYVSEERANGFKTLQYKNESTFWNGGYLDYLDDNCSSQDTESQYYYEEDPVTGEQIRKRG